MKMTDSGELMRSLERDVRDVREGPGEAGRAVSLTAAPELRFDAVIRSITA